MIQIQTKKNTVKVFTDDLDATTKKQITATARDPAYADSKIRVMPDTHAGRGCVIGMTMTLCGRVSPSLVGVDIGCGMEVVKLADTAINLPTLDDCIRASIPSGKHIREEIPHEADSIPLHQLKCADSVDITRAKYSFGTLGGGNHFIEIDRDEDGALYLVIHSGSRSLGAAIANHYRDRAYEQQCKKARRNARVSVRDQYDRETDRYDITRFGVDAFGDQAHSHHFTAMTRASRRDSREKLPVKWETALCEGQLYEDYLQDMAIAVAFADENRRLIAQTICEQMGFRPVERFSCVHNYIDGHRILRKGAISARLGERVFIPLNMKDGALIGRGLGNPDWNFSAPHGAGRACSRSDAKHAYSVEDYQRIMAEAGVFTTTACKETLDECPMAYKSMDRILPYLGECVAVESHILPIYNFKSPD